MSMSEFLLKRRLAALEHAVEELQARPQVKFKRLHPDAVMPRYMTPGAAGMDLTLHTDDLVLMPEATALVGVGLAIELPPGYEAQVRPRSGLAAKFGITVLNAPGTIDEDYRGEIKVLLINHGELHTLHRGERIAQIVIAKAVQADVIDVEYLTETERGAGGIGSTGAK